MKTTLKKIVPTAVLVGLRPWYHGTKAQAAAARYGYPAKKLHVIGITGTKGKTTTATYTGRLLNLAGTKTGYLTTSVINLGEEEFLNPHKMTTIDPVKMQEYLARIVKNGCTHVVLELSSQGLAQHRHWGLGGLNTGVFLNIYPEHIEAHGGFSEYVAAKAKMFSGMRAGGTVLLNSDFTESEAMWAQVKRTLNPRITRIPYSIQNDLEIKPHQQIYKKFRLSKERKYRPTLFSADFEVANAYVASLIGEQATENSLSKLLDLAATLTTVPGRMEWVIREGKNVFERHSKPAQIAPEKINVLVDYAHEPASMEKLLRTLRGWCKRGEFKHLIHVVSCDGVGRDDWKKPILGKLSFDLADYSVYTTDNYEAGDDPQAIVKALQKTIPTDKTNKTIVEVDRQKAFSKALNLAKKLKESTLLVSTGVGTEQGLTQPEGVIVWDERTKWLETSAEAFKLKKNV